MNIEFDIRPQLRQIAGRGRRVAIVNYREDGRHFGAVGIMAEDPQRGPMVTITKPVSPDGLIAIGRQLVEYAKDWPRPTSTPGTMADPPAADQSADSQPPPPAEHP